MWKNRTDRLSCKLHGGGNYVVGAEVRTWRLVRANVLLYFDDFMEGTLESRILVRRLSKFALLE